MIIYCTGCGKDIEARLTNGEERYPHRPDLYDIPFWKCDTCKNYVGCHHKTKDRIKPMGCIATPDMLNARKKIHALLDPLWESGKISRGAAYRYIMHRIGHEYHTGEIRSIKEAREVYRIVGRLHNQIVTGIRPTKEEREVEYHQNYQKGDTNGEQ